MAAADASGSTVLTAPPYPVAVAVFSISGGPATAGLADSPAGDTQSNRSGEGSELTSPVKHGPLPDEGDA